VLAAVFVIAGCSGASKAHSPPGTAKRTVSDTILAKHAVLQLRDLPTGYTELRTPAASSDRSAEEKVLSCLGIPDACGGSAS
jgi:hypothetical protein